MAFVIAAPASGSGKTLLSIVLASWARQKKLNLQTFKVGPDYLDPQQLSAISQRPCRNLDLTLCGSQWVKDSFYDFGGSADLALIEGVMGLFDGVGSSSEGSTAALARFLQLPIVLVVDARGQAASLAALVRGFQNQDPQLQLAGVVLNYINSQRHKTLLTDVLANIDVKLLGCIPNTPELSLPNRHLGLAPAHEIIGLEEKIQSWSAIAEANLDLTAFKTILTAPKRREPSVSQPIRTGEDKIKLNLSPIAIAEDQAFHFRYPETKEYLEQLGMPFITWKPIEDIQIPKGAKGLIIPGGFPEQYAEQLSNCHQSISSLRSFFGKRPIYAECGGMLLLGKTLTDLNGEIHPMAGLLPFHSQKGPLKVGYRDLKCNKNGLIVRKGEHLTGHEFHRWKLDVQTRNPESKKSIINIKQEEMLNSIWKAKGWREKEIEEGWGSKLLHASWIHLHWPSSLKIIHRWRRAIDQYRE